MNKEHDMHWEKTQKWADQKIAGVLAIAERQGDKLLVGADPRDVLTTKEQQLALMQEQAINLRKQMDAKHGKNMRTGANLARKATKSSQDELFDLFAERLAKKLGELNNKKPLA